MTTETIYHYELAVTPGFTPSQKQRLLEFALALSEETDAEHHGTFILSERTSELDLSASVTTFTLEEEE